MLNHLHNSTPLQVTARLPANDEIFRIGKARLGIDPKDTRTPLALCCAVSEEALGFGRCVTRLKGALHDAKDIDVTRDGLGRDVVVMSLQKMIKRGTASVRRASL